MKPRLLQQRSEAGAAQSESRFRDDLGASLPSQELARHLLAGNVGLTLYFELAERFPTIRRTDVFFGIALAWTDLQAAQVAAEAEISDLRRQLCGRSA